MARYLLAILPAILLPAASFAGTDRDTGTGPAAGDEAVLSTLPNGLRLLVLPRPDDPMVSIDVYVEPARVPARAGLAHLCEHLLFSSSEGAPRGSLVDSLLLNGGTFNAATTLGGIHLYGTCLPSRLAAALALEADRLGRLRPEPADLERERNRVLGEHDLHHESLPASSLELRVMAMAFAEEPSAGDPLLGAPEDIRAITMQDVERFLRTSLSPGRTCVLVTGPVAPDEVAAMAAGTLGLLSPAADEPPPPATPRPPAPREPWTRDAETSHDLLVVGFRLPCGTEQDLALAHLAAAIMARENGDPRLSFRGDEVLLTLHIEGDWTAGGAASEGAGRAMEQFWDQTRRVLFNVADEWMFNRNRAGGLAEFRKRLADARERADWRAQRLASGRFTPDPATLAAIIDTLAHRTVSDYFEAHFTRDSACVALAAARPPRDPWLAAISRHRRLEVNPYLDDGREGSGLDAGRIEPLLATAAAELRLPEVATSTLPDGSPLHVVGMPGDTVLVAAARTFRPDLAGKEGRRLASRLSALEWLANCGYGSTGARVEPRGFGLGSNARVSLTPGSVSVIAGGIDVDVAGVVADIRKRLQVSSLNVDALRYYQDEARAALDEIGREVHLGAVRACVDRIGAPWNTLASYWLPTLAEIRDWNVGEAERQLGRMLDGNGYAFFVVGARDDGSDRDVAAAFAGPVSRQDRDREEEPVDPSPPASGSGTGFVVHYAVPEVASVLYLGGGCGPSATEDLGATDLEVLARIVEERVRAAASGAGLDSLSVEVIPQAMGALTLPWVRIAVPTHRIAAAVSVVQGELAALTTRPVGRDEEARARLVLLGPQIKALGDVEGMMEFVMAAAARGTVPSRPLADLCTLRTELLADRARRLFPPGTGAFAVIGDTTTVEVAKLLRELGGP